MLAGFGFYLFVVHMLTATTSVHPAGTLQGPQPVAGLLVMFAVGMVLLASSALMAPWLQNLANYPVETAGLVMAPRGLGTMVAMVLAGRVAARIDPRVAMATGILCVVWSVWEMTG